MENRELIDRLLRGCIPEPNSGCWLWIDALTSGGYGQLRWDGLVLYAHRVSFELFRGPIPDGLELDHLCRVRCCVNPYHLEPVTGIENTRRGLAGEPQRARTHCPHGHEYTPENTYRVPGKVNRFCRSCHYRRNVEQRKRAELRERRGGRG